MNGKPLTSPNLRSVICKITDARLVRRISGSVNSGRSAWSPSSHKRMQTLAHPATLTRTLRCRCLRNLSIEVVALLIDANTTNRSTV